MAGKGADRYRGSGIHRRGGRRSLVLFYGMAALLARRVGHVSPEARVDPDFQRRLIEVEFEGIAQFRAGQAIRAGVAMAIAFWKEGLLWRITQSKT